MTQADTHAEHKLLCLPLDKLYYGFELEHVVETVQDVQITPIPCLPECYCGVCNHKGTIVPVVSLDRLAGRSGARTYERPVTVMVRCGDHTCGILTGEKPVILDIAAARSVQEDWVDLAGHLMIQDMCATDGGVVLLVDAQATLEGLIVCR